jgi:hypothetical protein
MKKYSKNTKAKKIMGKRPTGSIAIDGPCELGYHCPVCEYPHLIDGNYDERLTWSEYNGFLWCSVCNLDIPSCLCIPDLNLLKGKPRKKWVYSGLKDAIECFLDLVEGATGK